MNKFLMLFEVRSYLTVANLQAEGVLRRVYFRKAEEEQKKKKKKKLQSSVSTYICHGDRI